MSSSQEIFTSSVTNKRNNSAKKIQSAFKGYNTRKLTNNIKKNSRKYLQGPSRKKERRNEVFKILESKFDKTYRDAHNIDYDARDEVKLIMSNLGQIEQGRPRLRLIEELEKLQKQDAIEYTMKIISLVKKIKNKLNGFIGTTEQSRAKVYKELEELRYLFYIPFFKSWGWSHSDQDWKRGMASSSDAELIDDKKFYKHYEYYHQYGEVMHKYIAKELPTLFPKVPDFPKWDTSYMRRAGGKKNTYKRKFHKTSL